MWLWLFVYWSEFYQLAPKTLTKFLKEYTHNARCQLAPRKRQQWYKKKIFGSLNLCEQEAHWEDYTAANIGKINSVGTPKRAENGPEGHGEFLGARRRPNERKDKFPDWISELIWTSDCSLWLFFFFLNRTIYCSFRIPSHHYESKDWKVSL